MIRAWSRGIPQGEVSGIGQSVESRGWFVVAWSTAGGEWDLQWAEGSSQAGWGKEEGVSRGLSKDAINTLKLTDPRGQDIAYWSWKGVDKS